MIHYNSTILSNSGHIVIKYFTESILKNEAEIVKTTYTPETINNAFLDKEEFDRLFLYLTILLNINHNETCYLLDQLHRAYNDNVKTIGYVQNFIYSWHDEDED